MDSPKIQKTLIDLKLLDCLVGESFKLHGPLDHLKWVRLPYVT